MSEASPKENRAHGIPAATMKNAELLTHMKLNAPDDLFVFEKLLEWVSYQEIPPQVSLVKVPLCCSASALVLQRLVRAFENRQGSASDDVKNTKTSTTISTQNNPASHPQSSPQSISLSTISRNAAKNTSPTKRRNKIPTLSVLMGRKVKVTQLVRHAVQFLGSDVLKVLYHSQNSPTVLDVANVCIKLLHDEIRIKKFYLIFCRAVGKEASSTEESSAVFFGVFALQTLQSLRSQAISAYEFAHDFEKIYRTCYEDKRFQMCMHVLKPALVSTPAPFAPDLEARNICWKLARLLALKSDNDHKSDPDAMDHRRNRILISASSIVFAANMGNSIMKVPYNTEFVPLVATSVNTLMNFLAQNSFEKGRASIIFQDDIRPHVMKICMLMNRLTTSDRASNVGVIPPSSNLLFSTMFSPEAHYAMVHDYRKILHTLETQMELKISTVNTDQEGSSAATARTGIVNVLLFYPMVFGEPWGIHRDAPMITSRKLCLGQNSKPTSLMKDYVAIVMKIKAAPTVIKRKAANGESNSKDFSPTGNKKARVNAISEPAMKIPNSVSHEPIDLVEEDSLPPSITINLVEEIDAPIVNHYAELNEWTLSVLSLSVVKPTDTLLTYLGENDRVRGNSSSCLQDVIVPVLNRGLLRIQNVIGRSSYQDLGISKTKLAIGRTDGQVLVDGLVDQNVQLCASIVGLYYTSLDAIVQEQMERVNLLGSFGSELRSKHFHRALLACCFSCVMKGIGMNKNIQTFKNKPNITIQILMETTETESFTLLKVVELFCRAHNANKGSAEKYGGLPIISGLPVILLNQFQKIEVQLIDSVLWNTLTKEKSSTQAGFVLTVKTMKSLPGAWPPDVLEPILPEEMADAEADSSKPGDVRYKTPYVASSEGNFVTFVLRKLLKCVFSRVQAICAALNLSSERTLQTQILVAFRYLLRHHISIFNDRHVDQLLLSTIYGICRVMKIQPKISFGKIIDAYFTIRGEEQGERACRFIVTHVKLNSPEADRHRNSEGVGNIITFYNTVYVPKMQKYFLGSKSLKTSAELYQTSTKQEERTKENRSAQKKRDNANASDSVTNVPVAAATQSKQNTESKMINLNSSAVHLRSKLSTLSSAKTASGPNESSPIMGNIPAIREPRPHPSYPVVQNQTLNGSMLSRAQDAGVTTTNIAISSEKPIGVALESVSEKSKSKSLPEQNKPGTSSTNPRAAVTATQLRYTNTIDLVADVTADKDKNKESKRVSQNTISQTEKAIDDSRVNESEIMG